MICQTESHKRIKKEQQEIWDFAILICQSVPTLKKTIKGFEESIPNYSIPKPDYFIESIDKDRLKSISNNYKSNLGKYIILSLFSFFESYFKSVMIELIDFHGGKDKLIENLKKKNSNYLNQDECKIKFKRKLQEPIKDQKFEKYKKYSNLLIKEPYFRFPSELFAFYGLQRFIDDIMSDNYRSQMIPHILQNVFLMNLSPRINDFKEIESMDLAQTFDSVRKIRNKIAHGDKINISIKKVSAYSDFLREFAIRIDNHLLEHFFIIEKYM